MRDLEHPHNIFAVIWTTTPWTLPANQAIALHKDVKYVAVKVKSSNDILIMAESRLESVLQAAALSFNGIVILVDPVPVSELIDETSYMNPLLQNREFTKKFYHADFVSAHSGSGLVHVAPGHGFDDYVLGNKLGLDVFAPVDDFGRFTADVQVGQPEKLVGQQVLEEGNSSVLSLLAGAGTQNGVDYILATHEYIHSYPVDWRTKQPVIIRATEQWFTDLKLVKTDALKALQSVDFIPMNAKHRLENFLESRDDWCISRQRAWGVPIPALFRSDGSSLEAVMTAETVAHIIKTIRARGIEAWWSDPVDDPAWIPDHLPQGWYYRGQDTMDVWFDSGTSWTSLINSDMSFVPADLCIEGSDQHRGWFQSQLLTYVASRRSSLDRHDFQITAPYKSLITHGFVLDDQGRKMSKSVGNVIEPSEIVEGSRLTHLKTKHRAKANRGKAADDSLGPDALRLWVSSVDYTRDVQVGDTTLKTINDMLHKLRVTLRWLLGVLADCDVSNASLSAFKDVRISYELSEAVALIHLQRVCRTVQDAYESIEPFKVVSALSRYVNNDLSSFYFETAKDPLYAGTLHERKMAQAMSYSIFESLQAMLAPITPLLVAECLDYASEPLKTRISNLDHHPFKRVWSATTASLKEDIPETSLEALSRIHAAIRLAQERARNEKLLKSGLQCRVLIKLPLDLLDANGNEESESVGELLRRTALSGELARFFVVSRVDVIDVNSTSDRLDLGASDWNIEQAFSLGDQIDIPGIVTVHPPAGSKCVRCWRYVVDDTEAETPRKPVDQEASTPKNKPVLDHHEELCKRCVQAMSENEDLYPVQNAL